jgi:hypothetical protein
MKPKEDTFVDENVSVDAADIRIILPAEDDIMEEIKKLPGFQEEMRARHAEEE